MTSPDTPSPARFCRLWAESLATVLEQIGVTSASGSAAELSAEPAAPPASASVAARFAGGGALRGELLLHAEAPVALQLAQALMSEPLDPAAEFNEQYQDAFGEIVRQAAGLVATAWKRLAGAETVLSFHSATEPAFPPARQAVISVSGKDFPSVSLRLYLSPPLCEALQPAPEAVSTPARAAAAAAGAGTASAAAAVALEPGSSGNLDLLLDVALEATIRFGEREMRLREVLGLLPGAVIELNQHVNEPADLLVAGRMVARGEVVVVDGNFGLRVTEVASPAQRASLLNTR